MILDANKKNPYDSFQYYFIKGSSSLNEDEKLLKACFNDEWRFTPKQGYQNLKIISDDITYANYIPVESELYKKLINSLNGLEEDLTLDDQKEDGEIFKSKANGKYYYILSTDNRLKFISWIADLDDNTYYKICGGSRIFNGDKKDLVDSLRDNIFGRWIIGRVVDNYGLELYVVNREGDASYFKCFNSLSKNNLRNFLDEKIIELVDTGKNVDEDLEIDSVDLAPDFVIANALADKIGDCVVNNNIIYHLWSDFERYNEETDETIPTDRGIFFIYEVVDGEVFVYNPKLSTYTDIANTSTKGLDYYKGNLVRACPTLYDFIMFLNSYFGDDWFAPPEETEEFLDVYQPQES